MAAAIPAVMAVTSIASAGVSIYSAYRQNQASQSAASSMLNSIPQNTAFSEMQKEMLIQQAEHTKAQGEIAESLANASAQNQLLNGEIIKLEADIEAERERKAGKKLRARQAIAFQKNGVVLAGSPMLVLEETIEESENLAKSIETRGELQAGLAKTQASQTKARGRAQLLGAHMQANARVFEANSIGFQTAQQNAGIAAQAGATSFSGTLDALQTGLKGVGTAVKGVNNFFK